MKFNTYYIFARVIPATLTLIPFFILYYFLLLPLIGSFFKDLFALKIVSDISIPIALFFLLIQLNRITSKEIFENKIFNKGLNFPTANILLHSSTTFSSGYLKKIHNKIKSDFNISIPNKNSEIENEEHSRKCIKESISHIQIKVGKGQLVQQHNIEYGFIRNFLGGSFIDLIISIINIIVFSWLYYNKVAFIISIIFLIIYFIIILFSKKIVESFGTNYAKKLIQEYMSL